MACGCKGQSSSIQKRALYTYTVRLDYSRILSITKKKKKKKFLELGNIIPLTSFLK